MISLTQECLCLLLLGQSHTFQSPCSRNRLNVTFPFSYLSLLEATINTLLVTNRLISSRLFLRSSRRSRSYHMLHMQPRQLGSFSVLGTLISIVSVSIFLIYPPFRNIKSPKLCRDWNSANEGVDYKSHDNVSCAVCFFFFLENGTCQISLLCQYFSLGTDHMSLFG